MNNKVKLDKSDTSSVIEEYVIRNRWMVFLFFSLFFLTVNSFMKEIEGIPFLIPDLVMYIIGFIGLVYSGVLNIKAGTLTAKLFRFAVLFLVIFYFAIEFFKLF